jgi:outer membrane receptor protein involved in Fe transport
MKKMLLRFARLAPLALLFAGVAVAQTAGTITGIVTDGSNGKPVVGAVVVATSPAAPGEKSTVTDAAGSFTLGGLPAGRYRLSASFEGYKTEARTDLALGENVTLRANLAIVPEEVRMEEVVVTGSRIRRKDLNTPAPVTLLSKETMTQSGKVGIGDFLQSLPEQGNAINTGVNNGGDGSTRVSLRSLGSSRTLVLVNGRRLVAGGTGADASADLNGIPAAAIERIEVLKDGASALYGSDAIGGVVNIITKRNWNGTEVTAYKGISGQGDAGITDVSVTAGTAGERGSIVFSAGYFKEDPSWAGDRAFSKLQFGYDQIDGVYTIGSSRVPGGRVSLGGTGNATFTAVQGVLGTTGYALHDSKLTASAPAVAACLASNPALTLADCQWRKFDASGIAGAPGASATASNYNFAPLNYLQTPAERVSVYAAGESKLGTMSRGYFEASYVNRQSRQQLAPEPLIIGAGGVVDPGGKLVAISASNIYNPFGKNIGAASMRLEAFGPRTHKEDLDTLRIVGGLDGTLPDLFGPLKGWFWDASVNYGRTYGTFVLGGSLQSSRIAAALGPSMRDTDGSAVCVGTPGDLTTKISGCVPLDLFHGSAAQTAAQRDYLAYIGTSNGTNKLTSYQINTSGELFKLMADRPAGLALGVEYRDVAGSSIQEPLTAKFDTSNGGGANTQGSYNVKEGYAELVLPILSNMPGVEDLELSAAGRIFNYSNFGSDKTYKLGGRWKPVKDVTVRGTYSTAFRAPSIPDLFTGVLDNFPSVSDPCAGNPDPTAADHINPTSALGQRCGAAVNNGDDSTQLKTKEGGNPALKPETAKVYTAGLVFEPSVLPGFTATVDYYNVDINKAITVYGANVLVSGCYTTGLQPQYCSLIVRDPATHQIDTINDVNQNAGKEVAAGIDLALRYNQPTESFGRFTFTFDGTWLQKHNLTLADGTVIKGKGNYDLNSNGQGGTNPDFKFNAGVLWGLGGGGAGVTMKFINGFKECGETYDYDVGVQSADYSGSGACYVDSTFSRKVKAYTAFDAFLSYQLSTVAGKTSLIVGVNNFLDAAPPKIYNTFASATDQYTYDQIGRYFYARLSQSF